MRTRHERWKGATGSAGLTGIRGKVFKQEFLSQYGLSWSCSSNLGQLAGPTEVLSKKRALER